jgi:hypothetical protein
MEKETMTVSIPEEITETREIRVYDELGPRTITGWTVADLSWTYAEAHSYGHDHWTDIALYRVVDNPNMQYAVQIIGRSSVYHRVGGPCSRGVTMLVGKLGEDDDRYQALKPCLRDGCKPVDLDDLKNSDSVKVEVNLSKLYECRDADEVVAATYSHGRRDGKNRSGLSIKLLTAAAMVDAEIEQALMRMSRD